MLLKLTVTAVPAFTVMVLMLKARFWAVRLMVLEEAPVAEAEADGEEVAPEVGEAEGLEVAAALAEAEGDDVAAALAEGDAVAPPGNTVSITEATTGGFKAV
jgi:hypothetical protein